MFNKIGELSSINIQSGSSVLAEISNKEIDEKFAKFAAQLKRVAPKAEDFLYFSCYMMTSAEASALNSDGSPKLTRTGEPVQVGWDIDEKTGSWKWKTNDPSIKPYKNANGDIFPESEVLKAYKNWIGKSLCIDHRSDTVDGVRGIILDTHYDRINKKISALCALDRVSFPELAKGVQMGYKNCVSMGTAVSVAVCFDCGQVARTEKEFCDCMRQKRTYGEINIGLSPIELSIVVNGADPQAKIRTILAHATELRNDLDSKEKELSKLALDGNASKIQELEDDLKKISEKLSELKASLEKEELNEKDHSSVADTDPTGIMGLPDMKGQELSPENQGFNFPARLANNNVLGSELKDLRETINFKFQEMDNSLKTLSHKIKEEIMSVNSKDAMNKEGYFQGAGGVNEPAPHQVKYPKDPANEKDRGEDKHMQSQTNFNMGPVDGMHPGVNSAGKSEEERKHLLQRAGVEERQMRRDTALKNAKENLMKTKEAYFQGGGEVNEPTPGKVKYPIDPTNVKDREKEDKQMVGQKPFPGVGDVDGLHPSPLSADQKDELARKKMLQRASLNAKFVRVAGKDGSQDLGKSAWQVFRGDDLIFTASVNEITSGNVDKLYDTVATREFGSKLLAKINSVGIEKAASIYKSAQAVSGMETMPAAPADMGSAAPVGGGADMTGAGTPPPGAPIDFAPPASDNAGDPKETAIKLAEEMRDRASDLVEAVRALTGEQAEMGELEEMPKAASSELKPLVKMQKNLNVSLVFGMKKAIAELNETVEELNMVADVVSEGVTPEFTETVVQEAFTDAKTVLADTRRLMAAFVTYAEGSANLKKQAQDFNMVSVEVPAEKDENDVDMEPKKDENHVAEVNYEDGSMIDANNAVEEENKVEDENDVMLDVDPNSLQGKKVEIKTASENLNTKEGRAALRAKLAAQSVEFSDMLDAAHKHVGEPHFDVKPSDGLGEVETINEVNKKMLDVAEAAPKVRKEAARLDELIKAGKVAVADLDKLVAQGLDADVVKYWKAFWGQAGKEGSQFAVELLKEHAKAQIEEEVSKFKVKISRAYELTNEMVRRGLVADDRQAITAQVDDILTYNDQGFEAMKRVINKHSLKKSASTLPVVGLINANEGSVMPKELSLQDALDQAFAGRRY